MAKAFRGKSLRSNPTRGRGHCPMCQRTGVKLLYEVNLADGRQQKVCKICRAAFSRRQAAALAEAESDE